MNKRTHFRLTYNDLQPGATCREAEDHETPARILKARQRRAIALKKAAGPAHQIRALALQPAGASRVFPQYRAGCDCTSVLALVSTQTGAAFSTSVERSVVDGEPIGVRVTVRKSATRHRATIQGDIDAAAAYAAQEAQWRADMEAEGVTKNVTSGDA
jgi:hypothetical protein